MQSGAGHLCKLDIASLLCVCVLLVRVRQLLMVQGQLIECVLGLITSFLQRGTIRGLESMLLMISLETVRQSI